jgi:hypothetical protein
MVNLLIISSHPKAKSIQDAMQPQLKARIDVLTDFDHGLKDVFEKRPAIVIIQDQIASVTGESVARHIQLLLGSGAPTFIVMHEGNARIRPIRGLFESAVDLNQDEADLIEELVGALKRILGAGWDKVAIPRQVDAVAHPSLIPASATVVAEEGREAADRLVDDPFFELGGTEPDSPRQVSADRADTAPVKEPASNDQLASLLLEAAQEAKNRQVAETETTFSFPQEPPRSRSGTGIPITSTGPPPFTGDSDSAFDFPELLQSPTPTTPANGKLRTVPAAADNLPGAVAPPQSGDRIPPAPARPADFRISAPTTSDTGAQAEDILTPFDYTYRSRSRTWLVLATLALVVVIGGWYLLKRGSDLSSFFQKQKTAAANVPAAPQPDTAVNPGPSSALQKPLAAKGTPVNAALQPLPSFVPLGGRDESFSSAKPGWERYVDSSRDFRILRSAGRIKAIQIIAARGQGMPDSFLEAVLKEVAGSSELSIVSNEKRRKYTIRRCRLGQKGDLLVYREVPSDAIRAFVVSLD